MSSGRPGLSSGRPSSARMGGSSPASGTTGGWSLPAPRPPSIGRGTEAAQELKLLSRDDARLVREQTRRLNPRTATLTEDSPRAREVCPDLTAQRAGAFLRALPTPAALAALTPK